MKGLLQSKKFRKNLSKWLLAYVGVMMLLTTVITYSRYVSKYQGNDAKAEAAKFNIKIKKLECRDSVTGAVCNQEAYWSTEDITYYFLVDTTEVEVSAIELLTIRLNKAFRLESVEEITNLDAVMENGIIVNLRDITTNKLTPERTVVSNDYTIPAYNVNGNIDINNSNRSRVKAYRITVKFDRQKPTNMESYRYNDIISLDYVATQKN